MNKLLLIIVLFANTASAQIIYKNSEWGFGLGASNYYGDLNQEQNFKFPRYCGTLFFKHNFNPYISLKLTTSYANVGADDKNNTTAFEKYRNLRFESDIYEATFQSEFNFLYYEPGDFDNRWTPYVTVGLGAFHFNPYTKVGDSKYFLKPLGTEGQNLAQYKDRIYKTTQMVLPVGMGMKFWMSGRLTMGFEAGYRFTNTDYLDDVSTTYVGLENFPMQNPGDPYQNPARQLQDRSTELTAEPLGIKGRQRGIASTKDQYLFAQLTFSFRLSEYACPR